MAILLPRSWGRQKPPLGAQVNRSHPLSQGLAGCWLFNERGGLTAVDGVGSKALSLSGAVSLSSTGLSCAGGTALAPAAPTVFSGSPLSMEAWVTPNAVTGAIRCVTRLHTAAGGSQALYQWSDNTWVYYTEHSGGGDALSSGVLSVVGKPVHIVSVLSGTTKTVYINGAVAATGVSSLSPAAGRVYVGNDAFSQSLNGVVSVVRYYTRALSPAEVAFLYADPYQMVAPPVPLRVYSVPSGGGVGLYVPRYSRQLFGSPFLTGGH